MLGLDVNRNYDFLWDFPTYFDPSSGIANSTDPCDSETYYGPSAFSEPESKNAQWIFDTYPNIRFFVDLHSFGENILYSWGDDQDQSSDPNMNFRNSEFDGTRGLKNDSYGEYIPANDLAAALDLASEFHSGIQAFRGRNYILIPSCAVYPTAGTSADYAYSRSFVDPSKAKVISYTLEWGSNSNPTPFHPENSEMQNIIQEITCGLLAFCLRLRNTSGMDVSHNPANGDQNVAPWPATLEWEDQANEVEWEVQASTSPDFDRDLQTKQTPVATRPPNGSAYSSVNFNLKPDTNYYWRVHAKRNPSSSGKSGGDLTIVTQPSQDGSPTLQTGWGDWSLLRYFKTDARASTLKSPLGTSPKVYPWGNNEFKWTAVEGGKQYWLDTSENEDLGIRSNLGPGQVVLGSPQNIQPNNPLQSLSLSGVLVDPSDPNNTGGSNLIKHVLPFPLKVNHTYYWGVLPYGPENIQGNWSNDQNGQIFETSAPQTKLASPENAATVSPWGIALEWEETRGAIGYALKVSTHPDLSDNIYTGPDPRGTSQVLNLAEDTGGEVGVSQVPQIGVVNPAVENFRSDYYWSVTPKGPPPYNEKGRASKIWGFNIDPQAIKPVPISPPNGSHVPYKQPSLKFTWKPVDHAVEYVFTLYNRNADGSRGATLDSKSIPASQESNGQAYVDLNNEGVTNQAGYCWQVQAIGPKDLQGNSLEGPPSDIFCYSLAPDKPIITSPPDGASGVEYNPTTFTWESEWAPGGYMISIAVPGSSSGWVNVSGKSYTVDLKSGTTYYWTVDAKGLKGELTNSEQAHFSTKAAACNAPDVPQILDPPGNADGQLIPNPYRYTWSSVPDAVQYEFTVIWHRDPDDWTNQVIVYHSYYTGTVSDPVTLSIESLYVWQVRAKSSCGAWSDPNQSGYIYTLGN